MGWPRYIRCYLVFLLVVPGRALASVSPDGERSVNFVLQWSYFMYKFCNESEGSCDPSG